MIFFAVTKVVHRVSLMQERITIQKQTINPLKCGRVQIFGENPNQSILHLWSKSGNAEYRLVHNILSPILLSKNIKFEIHRIIILPIVLYGCETWSLTLKEECRLREFENRALWRIFEPKTDKLTGEWRKLLNEELHDLYFSQNIMQVIKSKIMRWERHVARIG